MKESVLVVALEAVALALIVLITLLLVFGSIDEFSVKIHLGRALDSFYGNNWDDAIAELDYCMMKKPDFAPPFELAGYIHLFKGDLDTAEKTYKTAVENAGEKATPASALGLVIIDAIRTAYGNRNANDLKDAARTIEHMKDDLAETDALISAAAVMTLAGDTSGAKQALRSLAGETNMYARGGLPVLYNTEGVLAYHDDLKEDSRTFFRKASRLAGPWQTPQTNFSAMFVATISAHETTKEALNKLIPGLLSTGAGTSTPDQAYLYHNALGVIAYMRLGSKFYDRAIDQFDRAIVLKPDEPWAKFNKAVTMTLRGGDIVENAKEKNRLFGEADRLYSNVLEKPGLDGGTKYLVFNALGILSEKKGDRQEALEYFEKALELKADDYLVYRNIGSLYCRLKRYDLAKNYLLKGKEFRAGQKDVDKALKTLQVKPEIESASVRYTPKSKPTVVVKASVHSSPTTVENCKIQITFNNTPAYFLARPGYITCMPVYDLPGGEYKLNVVLTDAAGNETARSFDLSIDISPPKIEAVIPPRNGSVKGPNPEMSVKFHDELSEVDLSTIMLRYRTSPGANEIVSQDVIVKGKYCYNMPGLKIKRNDAVSSNTIRFVSKTKLPPGGYRLQAEVKDVLGNSVGDRWDFSITE